MSGFSRILFVSAIIGVAPAGLVTAQGYNSNDAAKSYPYPQSQGWSQSQMKDWYELSQGSRLIPMRWLEALKTSDGRPFLSRANLESYGYAYMPGRQDALPIGFVLDTNATDPSPWLGFNCSACHTSRLKVGAAEVLVHGGQSMADLQSLMNALIDAVSAVRKNDAAFAEFATKALDAGATEEKKAALRDAVDKWLALRGTINATGAGSRWGRGRTDAVGVILATTAMIVADPKVPVAQREPLPASNAPVSYPFIWNANQQARLQHNGIVDNGKDLGIVKVAKVGALIRNWTEAMGVFADVKLEDDGRSVKTSIRMDNLLLLEQALAELQSPRWPEAFGKLDETRRARGAAHYRANCQGCHAILDPANTKSPLGLIDRPLQQSAQTSDGYVYLQPVFDKRTQPAAFAKTHAPSPDFIGTDPSMTCNALVHKSPSGRLQGQLNAAAITESSEDRPFGDHAVTTDLLRVLIQRDIKTNPTSVLLTIAENQIGAAGRLLTQYAFAEVDQITGQGNDGDPLARLRAQLRDCATVVQKALVHVPDSPTPMYKARPLNGIWATAPYLHNGSVPTLYDLLLPQDQRPKSFGYFDGEMDVVKGGLKDASKNPAAYVQNVYRKDGSLIIGNWNGGHEYGVQLSHDQKLDLVEYLKGL